MTTTGTATFNLDLAELIEEAFERTGKELRSGYDFRTARRSLNLLTVELANRGINLWTLEQIAIPMVKGTITYDLPVDTIDLLDSVTRVGTGQNQIDININRISESAYIVIPNKNTPGRPIQVWVNRQSGATYPTGVKAPQIYVWPAPDQGTLANPYYTFISWRMRRIQDAGDGVNTQDIPFRFMNVLIAGLAFYLSMKLPDVDPNRMAMLKTEYEQQFQMASDEDREKASVRFVPRIARI
jgi:hypothetical protein